MNRTKKFVYNSTATAIHQLITMIVGFITPRIMLSIYGSEINGLVTSVAQFISYFNLVEAGLSSAAVYALYAPLAQNNHSEINSVVTAAKRFYTQTGVAFVALTIGLSVAYPIFLKSDLLSPVYIGILVLILGVNGALEFFTLAKYRVLLTADQKTYILSALSIVHILIQTVLIVVMANFRVHIVLVRFIVLFSVFIRSLLLLSFCKKNYPFLDFHVTPNTSALNKRWDALNLQILGVVQNGAPVLLLTLFLKNLKLVSVYSVFNMVIAGISGVLGIFISGLSSSFGDIIARKDLPLLQKTYKEFEFAYYFLITVIYSITFITIMPFIRIYTRNITDVQYDLPVIGFLFVLNGLLYNVKTPQGMLVISAGLFKETKMQTTIQTLIAVVLGGVLVFFWGIAGVLIGAIASNLYRDIDLLYFVTKNVTKTSVKHTANRIIRIFICTIITITPFFFIQYTLSTFLEWFIFAAIAGVYALLVTFVVNAIFDKNDAISILARFKSQVLKR